MYDDQSEFDVRCEWGLVGVTKLAPLSDVVVIVDVLSFSTCIDIALARGAVVYPFKWQEDDLQEFARSVGAVVARARHQAGYSLSPVSLVEIEAGTKLVLPSPNGSTLSLATGDKPTFAGCLRNAGAVAQAAGKLGKRISVVSAGERWSDGSMRPAIEDLIGAGAIISHLAGALSPEARVAVSAYEMARGQLLETLARCSSGKELIERDFAEDVRLAAQLDCSHSVPILEGGAYRAK